MQLRLLQQLPCEEGARSTFLWKGPGPGHTRTAIHMFRMNCKAEILILIAIVVVLLAASLLACKSNNKVRSQRKKVPHAAKETSTLRQGVPH